MNSPTTTAAVVSQSSTPVPAPSGEQKKKRGFAAMDRALVQEAAKKGGVAAHRLGKAHKFNSDEARLAGRKGGLAWHPGRRSVSDRAPVAPAQTQRSEEVDQGRA